MSNMQNIQIEKLILNVGGKGEQLEKGYKLLLYLTQRKPIRTAAKKRMQTWGIRPGLEIGAMVTLRKENEIQPLLKRLLGSVNNTLRKKQISIDHFSFGIHEYIEIPGAEYQRDIGIIGLDVILVFKRKGKRIALRKLKKRRLPKKQHISREEIIAFMEERYLTKFI
jgi:large subunit ribosomal protein L5